MTNLHLTPPLGPEHDFEQHEHSLRSECDWFRSKGYIHALRALLESELKDTPKPVPALKVHTVAAE